VTKRKAVKKKPGRSAIWARPSPTAMAKDTLGYFAERYVLYLQERNYSQRTSSMRKEHLLNFAAWCEARSLLYPQEITRPILERYQSTLFVYRKENGRPLSFAAQASRLITVRMLFKWLCRQRILLVNPASELELPKTDKRLPKHVLSAHEAEAVLQEPDIRDVLGLRDRALLEVLYATGIRRAELAALRLFDIDSSRVTLTVREGKGRRDRVVPLGERALSWVEKYMIEARPELAAAVDEGTLFLTNLGEPISLVRLTDIVRGHVQASGISKSGACHLFRHTAATLMLENGADIRYIQALLGHAKLETTSIYTQVSIHKLKEVHALTHPGARLAPPARAPEQGERERDEQAERQTLFSLLAAEQAEELSAGDSDDEPAQGSEGAER